MAAGWSCFSGPELQTTQISPCDFVLLHHPAHVCDDIRCGLRCRQRASFAQVVFDAIALNPGRDVGLLGHRLRHYVSVRKDKPYHVTNSINWSDTDLTALPESLGDLIIDGDLYLEENRLQSLPHSFGEVTVAGDLWLASNALETLPESFGRLQVGGELGLQHNQLRSLPASFGSCRVREHLHLHKNAIRSLPESFQELDVGGDIDLRGNPLAEWMETPPPGGEASLWNVKVGGTLRWDQGYICWDDTDDER